MPAVEPVLAPGELFSLADKVVVLTGASSGLGARRARRARRIEVLDGMIVFLAGDASSYVTVQHLLVDGGGSVY